MKGRGKVAVSVPADLLAEVERMRKQTGESRSAVFERALRTYVAGAARSASIARYREGYSRRPESAADQRAALSLALEALAAEPWDAPR